MITMINNATSRVSLIIFKKKSVMGLQKNICMTLNKSLNGCRIIVNLKICYSESSSIRCIVIFNAYTVLERTKNNHEKP